MTDFRCAALTRNEFMLDRFIGQIRPGDAYRGVSGSNSIGWILAHLARSRNGMLLAAGSPEPSQSWEDAVGRGGAKRGHPGVDLADAVAVWRRRGDRLRRLIPGLPTSQWVKAFPRTLPDGSATNGACFDFLIAHETFHLGQADLIAVALGRPGIP